VRADAGEIPRGPGAVGARSIPFVAVSGAEEMTVRFVAVAENRDRRVGAVRAARGKACRHGGGKSCRVRHALGTPSLDSLMQRWLATCRAQLL